jgi:hypothetical protein
MAFEHMRVSKVVASHERAIREAEARIETTDAGHEARRERAMRVVDGVRVHLKLALLCEEVRKVHRGVKFALYRNGKTSWYEGIAVPCEMWAYFEGDEFAFMRLGWADYSVRTGDGSKYGVYARTINNQKFGEDREQHFMVMADTLERALKNVKTHTRRYTPHETAAMTLNDFQSKVSSAGWTASSEYRDTYNRVVNDPMFLSEMRALVDNDHQFNSPLFAQKVRAMVAKHDENEAKMNEQYHAYWVQVREYMGQQVFDVLTVHDVKRASGRGLGEHKTYTAEQLAELDENLVARMSALSMLDRNSFVEGLGLKMSDTNYWVLK